MYELTGLYVYIGPGQEGQLTPVSRAAASRAASGY